MSITKVFGRRRKTLVSGGSGSEMEGRMSYVTRGLVTSAALLLLGGGIWANIGKTPLSEMRGLWITQASRGMAY